MLDTFGNLWLFWVNVDNFCQVSLLCAPMWTIAIYWCS